MLTAVLPSLRREYRTHAMARFAVWVVLYGAALGLLQRANEEVPGLLWFVFWVAAMITVGYYLVRWVRFVRQRLLWRLRRRLIVTYIFIAVVPILLILLLIGLGAFIINGQFAAFLVTLRVQAHADKLQQLSRIVAHQAYQARESAPEVLLNRLQGLYVDELSRYARNYPGLEVTIHLGSQTRTIGLGGAAVAKPARVPPWLTRSEFGGVVADEGQILLRAVEQGPTAAGKFALILSQPITPELLDLMGAEIGPVGIVATQETTSDRRRKPSRSEVHLKTEQGEFVGGAITSRSVPLPAPAGYWDFTVFGASTFEPVVWGGEREQTAREPVFVYVTSRIVTLNRQLVATLGRYSRLYVMAFLAVAGVFLLLEAAALIIGIRLTRSITATVDHLYEATERVKAGDFSHRIQMPARDQLTALGEAFDGMTASVERLLRESQEKSRLESELQIASEVQNQLFPQQAPRVKSFELYGRCRPARIVSGDYYDFLGLSDECVGIVLGDIAGKGISAALLMAAIQSALRAQVYSGRAEGAVGVAALSTGEIVGRLNRQLFTSTSPEKYATFFFAVYDGATRKLSYTNAGHLPPLVFRGGELERLEKGGTVVGLFSPVEYEQAVIQLEPGDLLLAYSDGITEPENIFGEAFGEERLLEAARRAIGCSPQALVEEIFRSVDDWTGSPELQDDMTLVVARVLF